MKYVSKLKAGRVHTHLTHSNIKQIRKKLEKQKKKNFRKKVLSNANYYHSEKPNAFHIKVKRFCAVIAAHNGNERAHFLCL